MSFCKLIKGISALSLTAAKTACRAPQQTSTVGSKVSCSRWLSVLARTSLAHGISKPYAAPPIAAHSLLRPAPAVGAAPLLQQQPARTRVMFSRTKGKPRNVRAVTQRFFRLHNGMWIRTIAGRHKKLWKKPLSRKRHATHHVFCTQSQCRLLDRMTLKYFKEKKYYPEDPYHHYHKLERLPDHRFVKREFYPIVHL